MLHLVFATERSARPDKKNILLVVVLLHAISQVYSHDAKVIDCNDVQFGILGKDEAFVQTLLVFTLTFGNSLGILQVHVGNESGRGCHPRNQHCCCEIAKVFHGNLQLKRLMMRYHMMKFATMTNKISGSILFIMLLLEGKTQLFLILTILIEKHRTAVDVKVPAVMVNERCEVTTVTDDCFPTHFANHFRSPFLQGCRFSLSSSRCVLSCEAQQPSSSQGQSTF